MGEQVTAEQCRSQMEPLRDMFAQAMARMDERDERMHERDRKHAEELTQVRLSIATAAKQAEVEQVKRDVDAVKTCAAIAKKSIGKWWAFVTAVVLIIISAGVAAWAKGSGDKVVVIDKAELKKLVGSP